MVRADCAAAAASCVHTSFSPSIVLSEEKCWSIVQWTAEGNKHKKVAKLAKYHLCTVQNVLLCHKTYGDIKCPYVLPRGRPRKLKPIHLDFLQGLQAQNPTLYLDEYEDALWNMHEIDVSVRTLCRTHEHLAYTHKKVSPEALERNKLVCDAWVARHGDVPAEWCFWLDKAHVDNRTNSRTTGYAPLGRVLVRRELFYCGTKYSMLPALSSRGIKALDNFPGSMT